MQLQTFYDIQVEGCRYGFVPAIFAFLVVHSAVAWYRCRQWFPLDGKTLSSFSPKVACVFFSLLTALAFVTTWGDYWNLRRALEAGKVSTLEGVVSNFHAAKAIKDAESFELSGHAFSYSKYAVKQGFHTLRVEGGPVADGVAVRIHYVGEQIVKLEVER